MKAIKFTALAAMLAFALLSVSFSSADAKKADTSDVLSPKSYGLKTYHKVNIAKSFDDQSQPSKPITYKNEKQKTQFKNIEAQKALEFAKKRYGM